MKSILAFTLFYLTHCVSWCQEIDQIRIDSITSNNEIVQIHISTSESFIVGANAYVLHIGAKPFRRNIHPNGSLQHIIFSLPEHEFNTLKKTDEIVLVYGYYYSNTQQDGESKQTNGYVGNHWKLGTINKNL